MFRHHPIGVTSDFEIVSAKSFRSDNSNGLTVNRSVFKKAQEKSWFLDTVQGRVETLNKSKVTAAMDIT